jgi:hypothetical protein
MSDTQSSMSSMGQLLTMHGPVVDRLFWGYGHQRCLRIPVEQTQLSRHGGVDVVESTVQLRGRRSTCHLTASGPSHRVLAEFCGRAESIDPVECGSELHSCTLYTKSGLGAHIVALLCRGRKGFREEGGFVDTAASCRCICCA